MRPGPGLPRAFTEASIAFNSPGKERSTEPAGRRAGPTAGALCPAALSQAAVPRARRRGNWVLQTVGPATRPVGGPSRSARIPPPPQVLPRQVVRRRPPTRAAGTRPNGVRTAAG